MQQVNAAIGLLKSVNNKLLKQYLLETWAKSLNSKDEKKSEKAANEILKAIDISTRK
jgi:DNA-binding FrmR family transcriptional regulator